MANLHVSVITQEQVILDDQVDLVLIPGVEGELGILPHHIPLITTLKAGVVTVRKNDRDTIIAIGGGFAAMEPGNHLSILADSAVKAQDISLKQAEAARQRAEEKMHQKDQFSDREFKVAEAELRRAIVELKVARKHQFHPL